jgi:hypothetical protein
MANEYAGYYDGGDQYLMRRQGDTGIAVAVRIGRGNDPESWSKENLPDIRVPWGIVRVVDTEFAEELLGIKPRVM